MSREDHFRGDGKAHCLLVWTPETKGSRLQSSSGSTLEQCEGHCHVQQAHSQLQRGRDAQQLHRTLCGRGEEKGGGKRDVSAKEQTRLPLGQNRTLNTDTFRVQPFSSCPNSVFPFLTITYA